jgi:peptide chain release factor 3
MGLDVDLEASPYETARWVSGTPEDVAKFRDANRGQIAEDRDGAPVFWRRARGTRLCRRQIPEHPLLKTRERAHAAATA